MNRRSIRIGVPGLKLLDTIMASHLPAGEAYAYPDSRLTSTKSGCTGAGGRGTSPSSLVA